MTWPVLLLATLAVDPANAAANGTYRGNFKRREE